MNAPASRKSASAAAAAAASGAGESKTATGFQPTMVHAYRRQPHFVDGKEQDVVVECHGEKVKFRANDEGHVVAIVKTERAFKRLTEEIPEAYIPYANGEVNVTAVIQNPDARPSKPAGDFVLEGGDGKFVVLDGQSDEDLRTFALEAAGLTENELPLALTGDTLRRAIFANLTGGQ